MKNTDFCAWVLLLIKGKPSWETCLSPFLAESWASNEQASNRVSVGPQGQCGSLRESWSHRQSRISFLPAAQAGSPCHSGKHGSTAVPVKGFAKSNSSTVSRLQKINTDNAHSL